MKLYSILELGIKVRRKVNVDPQFVLWQKFFVNANMSTPIRFSNNLCQYVCLDFILNIKVFVGFR